MIIIIIKIITITRIIIITIAITIAPTVFQGILRCMVCLHNLIESSQPASGVGTIFSILRHGKKGKERKRGLNIVLFIMVLPEP